MTDRPPAVASLRGVAARHGKFILLGLIVVLVPIAITLKSFQHIHKTVHGIVSKAAPGVEQIGGISIAFQIVVGLLLACWAVGWMVTRTEIGKQWLVWEKAKFFTRSPLLQTEKERLKEKEARKDGLPPPAPAQPALAYVAGGWQPGVIVEEQPGGWASVFVPELPSIATGRLFFVHQDQILHLGLSLDDFRTKLTAKGHGSADWLRALTEANLGAREPAASSRTDAAPESAPTPDAPA